MTIKKKKGGKSPSGEHSVQSAGRSTGGGAAAQSQAPSPHAGTSQSSTVAPAARAEKAAAKNSASGPHVTSLKKGVSLDIEFWPIANPRPYPKNARKWSARAIQVVSASIKEFGFRQPIVVDKEGVIIIGHLRLESAKKLGMTEVPVHVAKDLSVAQVKALRIADNRTSQESTWDFDLLGAEMIELQGEGFDLGITGFGAEELPSLLGTEEVPAFDPVTAEEQGQLDERKPCKCPACGHEWTPA